MSPPTPAADPLVIDPVATHATVPYARPELSRSVVGRVLPYVVTLSLGLWAGGLCALILFVSTLFVKARATATFAAPVLFNAFERYQLGLAAVSLLSLVLWRWFGRSKLKTAALAAALIATLLAVVQIGYITPTIERTQNTDRPTFDKFHHLASTNYTTISALVLLATGLSIGATKRTASVRSTV